MPSLYVGLGVEEDGGYPYIAKPVCHDPLHKGHHLWDVLGDPGHHIRFTNTQSSHVMEEGPFVSSGMGLKDGLIGNGGPLLGIKQLPIDILGGFERCLKVVLGNGSGNCFLRLHQLCLLQLQLLQLLLAFGTKSAVVDSSINR